MTDFPARLRQLLEQTESSKIDLSDSAGVSRQTLDNYLQGETEPDITVLRKIRDYFKDRYNIIVTMDYLIGEATEKVEPQPEPEPDENQYIKQEDNVIRFDLARIEHGKAKLCKCKDPHFEIDSANRLVMCSDCGAVMEPFEVLLIICRRWEAFEDYQKKAMRKIDAFTEEANRQFKRRLRNGWFKDAERDYLNSDMLPVCPHCDRPFDPIDSTQKVNRKYCNDWQVKKEARS